MLKRNIYYLLLILVVIVSCVIPPFVQSSTVHATTNQEQSNEIKYVNKNLGFSLIIPESWKDKFLIREDSNSISFVFRYNNQTYEDIRFFTIGYGKAQEEGWEKELRGARTLGKKGSMMYSSYNPLSLSDYNEFIPDQATRDIAFSMSEQIDAVLDSFQMIKSTGEPVNSGKNKEVIYTNDTHKFSLVLPENWKGKYSIDEFVEDIDAHTTKIEFYFTRKTDGYREPIFMIYKYDQKLYNSNAEGENSIPAHILAKENGEIYEIVVNNALQNYDRYAELFPNATKEENKILETMSRQIKEIVDSFKVLELKGAVAEEVKEARGYSFEEEKTTKIGDEKVIFSIIKTPIDNIRTEVIRKPISETNYIGINGGYYAPSYDSSIDYDEYKPCSISYYNPNENELEKDAPNKNSMFNRSSKNSPSVSRPTLVTYYDKKLQKTKAEIISANSMKQINDHFKNLDNNDHHHDYSNQVIINAIGGKGYDIEHFGNKKDSYSEDTLRRTVLAYREENGTVYAYLIVTKSFVTVERLKLHVEKLGFKENENIMLDASGSTSMRVIKPTGELLEDGGTEGTGTWYSEIGVVILAPFWGINSKDNEANRYSYNMIRVINTHVETE
ncbi:hypothetical protein [Bacillus cereus]|uniref:Phosphodiester glycosidase domain-containing protein n=1 Tax=Bacillus cereus TaxID=1396 RepID=A0A2A7I313_BACCE|nr:hypothetical protein [Bacillus cereus]PEC23641.1 hypothetical protein COM96_02035 [Bacillus cereus]